MTKSKANGTTIRRVERSEQIHGEGPNWVIVAGGALLTTLIVRLGFGFKLNRLFHNKNSNDSASPSACREKAKSLGGRRRSRACQLHSDMYCYAPDGNGCFECTSDSAKDLKLGLINPTSNEAEICLPLVKIQSAAEESTKEGSSSAMWSTSPDRVLGLPQRPFHHSNSSDSPPCVSESGSDIYIKRQAIQKLRQQLQRRDEMIMEMQSQIMDLRNSLSLQMAHSANLESQIDSANRDLFGSAREIQRLRKAIADHCVAADAGSVELEMMNGHINDYNSQLHIENLGEERRVDVLKKEIEDLKEVIEGRDFLLKSYREQKMELSSKINELELRLSSQVPNIL